MKETGTMHWNSPNTGATNSSGFSGLPGGNYIEGSYYNLGSRGYLWSSTQYSSTYAWYRRMYYDNGDMYRYYYYKSSGFNVRCLRD
jgi:uncharacterized protein (TIGR02145 family)